MAQNADQVFTTKFNTEITHAFQQKESRIRNAVTRVSAAPGQTIKIPVFQPGQAQRGRTRHSDLVSMNVGSDFVQLTPQDVYAPEYIDDLDTLKTNIDLRKGYSEAIAGALGRELDLILTEAMLAEHTNATDTGGVMDTDAIISLNKQLTNAKVPYEDRYLVIHAGAMEDLLADDKLTSSDFVTEQARQNGFVKNLMGFSIIILPDADLLPSESSAKHTCFAFHRKAVGLGMQLEPRVTVKEVAEKDAWLILGKMAAGAKVVLPTGVIAMEVSD